MKKSDNNFIRFVLDPPLWLVFTTWFLTVAVAPISILCAVFEINIVFSSIMYAIAAILLTYSVYCVVKLAPTLKARIKETLNKNSFTSRMMNDYVFRTKILSAIAFLINVAFVVFNVVMGIITMYGWYAVLASYYFFLCVARGWIFNRGRRAVLRARGDKVKLYENRLKLYRNSGIVLFILDIAMAGAVTLMILYRKPTSYTEITAIIYAFYTCLKVASAIRNIIHAQKHNDPQIQSFRNIGVADAAISIMSLTTALISTFSTPGTDKSMSLLTIIVGVTICLITILLGVYMIISANLRLKKLRVDGKVELDDQLTHLTLTDIERTNTEKNKK